ncbi:MAG TPA: anti-sigma factor [Brevibacterium sp.]|nr:anti-sigma factor [Brevibacterium sp.]
MRWAGCPTTTAPSPPGSSRPIRPSAARSLRTRTRSPAWRRPTRRWSRAPRPRRRSSRSRVPLRRPPTGPKTLRRPRWLSRCHWTRCASRRRWRMLAGAAAAAVVVAVAGLGGALLHVTGEQRELDESLAQSQEQLDRAEQLLAAPDVRTETVDIGDEAGMTVVSSMSEQMFQVRAHGSPSVPDDRVMQLWLIDDTGAHSVGFLADEAVTVDGSQFADGALVGVTEEPVGGSEQPTSDPLAVTEL